ncbi:Electron transfer flavoprotein subunit beta OS=Lysinibacillus sphaericus OX=1421 GN=etfB PE=3 SV=1 [Lysinibacillus sphaericus]
MPAQKAAGRILEGELSAQAKELVNLLHSEAKVV